MAAWSFVFEFLYKQIKKKRQQQVGGVSGDHRINVTNSINSKTNNQDKSAAAPSFIMMKMYWHDNPQNVIENLTPFF